MRNSRRNSRNAKKRRSGTENASRNQAPRREPYHASGASRTGARSRRAIVERQKKKKRRRMISRIGIAVLVLLAIVFAPTIFFQVSKINVTGDTRYTSEQLIKSTGVKQGDNMFFLDTKQIAADLKDEYPYLDTVKLRRKLPSTLQIEVSDRTAALSIEQNGKYLILDMSGKVLEKTKSAAKGTAKVTGVPMKGLHVGDTVDEDKYGKAASVMKLLELTDQYGMKKHIKTIDVEKAYDVRVTYDKRYTILLGALEESNLEHKIQFLKAILKEPSLPESGVIDLTDEKEARYRPTEDTTSDVVIKEEELDKAAGTAETKTESADSTDTESTGASSTDANSTDADSTDDFSNSTKQAGTDDSSENKTDSSAGGDSESDGDSTAEAAND
ncbi:MAG: FtsQ-type POTRA domain-containing protein [Eubacteriales bacterium]|nr:FtsQ-type POTRA domain-containing protein [Eubacteriales bacterium]